MLCNPNSFVLNTVKWIGASTAHAHLIRISMAGAAPLLNADVPTRQIAGFSRIDHPNAHFFPPTVIEVLGGFGQRHYCQKCFHLLLCTIKHLGCRLLLQTLVTEWECLTKYSTVTVITKWKWLGMTATQPQSAGPHGTTETEGQQTLWCTEEYAESSRNGFPWPSSRIQAKPAFVFPEGCYLCYMGFQHLVNRCPSCSG